jgi:hypothetical protein
MSGHEVTLLRESAFDLKRTFRAKLILHVEPGSPWENGYNESFNGKLRDECLNMEIFYTLKEAQILIERWRAFYNTQPTAQFAWLPASGPKSHLVTDTPAGLRYICRPANNWSMNMPDSNSGTGPPNTSRSGSAHDLGEQEAKPQTM